MKLREENKPDNRQFHELDSHQRRPFLDEAYRQAIAEAEPERGHFSPTPLPAAFFSGSLSREDVESVCGTVDRLNFVMTRLNMEGDAALEERVANVALLRFEYMFLCGNINVTRDPQVIVDLFTKRDKAELIAPALRALAEAVIDQRYMSAELYAHPALAAHLGPELTSFRFRSRMQVLIDNRISNKEKAAATLYDEGFDLKANDFNSWFAHLTDSEIKYRGKTYVSSESETAWLDRFIDARSKGIATDPIGTNAEPIHDEVHDTPHRRSGNGSTARLAEFHGQIDATLREDGPKALYWVTQMTPLVGDHESLIIDPSDSLQVEMWDNLWCGSFDELAYQLRDPEQRKSDLEGLAFNRSVLATPERGRAINPILAQDSFAMIVAGYLVAGDCEAAIEAFNAPELAEYKNEAKIRAAINLVWEMLHNPGPTTDDPESYKPPIGYLVHFAEHFKEYLRGTPSAASYLKIVDSGARPDLGPDEIEILRKVRSLDRIESLYAKLGIAEQTTARFLQIFDEVFDKDAEFASLYSEIRGSLDLITNPVFRRHVTDTQITERLEAGMHRALNKKDEQDSEKVERGGSKLALTIFGNPLLRPFLSKQLDFGKLVNDMIDDVVGEERDLLDKPLSVRNSCEIVFDAARLLETYVLADRVREYADPRKMQRMVSYLLAILSDFSNSDLRSLSGVSFDQSQSRSNKEYKRPDYFPDPVNDLEIRRQQLLLNIYNRERSSGGIDRESASTAVTNVLYRSTFVAPKQARWPIDNMLFILRSPMAELLPKSGPGFDALKEFHILKEFLDA